VEHHAGGWGCADAGPRIGGAMKRPEDEAGEDELTEEDKDTLEDLEKQHVPPQDEPE